MEAKTTTLCADNEKEVNIAKSENEECARKLVAVDERFITFFQMVYEFIKYYLKENFVSSFDDC